MFPFGCHSDMMNDVLEQDVVLRGGGGESKA